MDTWNKFDSSREESIFFNHQLQTHNKVSFIQNLNSENPALILKRRPRDWLGSHILEPNKSDNYRIVMLSVVYWEMNYNLNQKLELIQYYCANCTWRPLVASEDTRGSLLCGCQNTHF